MAKEKMKARVRYEKREDGREGYKVEIYSEGEWGLDTFFPLVAKAGAEDTDFIHWTFVRKLSELQAFGYDIDLRI